MNQPRSFFRDVVENSGLLGATSVVVRLTGIAFLVAIVRGGGTGAAGSYGIAVLVGTMGGFAFSLGLGTYCTRSFSIGEMIGQEVRAIHRLRAFAMLGATALLLAATPLLAPSWRVGFLLTAASVFVDQWNETGWVICRGMGRTVVEARADLVTNVALFGVALASVVMGRGLRFDVAGALLLATALARSAVAMRLVGSFPTMKWSDLLPVAGQHLRAALPYCASDMLGLAYLRGDTLVLAAFASSTVVGAYVAANALVGPLVQVAAMMGVASLALMGRYRREGARNPDQAETAVQHRALIALFAASGGAVAAALIVGLWIGTPLLFSSQVTAIRLLGVVLALFLPLRFANFALSAVLLAQGGAVRRLVIVAGSTLVNIVMNLAMDGRLAAFGAAWGTVLTEVVVTVLLARSLPMDDGLAPLLGVGGSVVAASAWLAIAMRGHHPLVYVLAPTVTIVLAGGAVCAVMAVRLLRNPSTRDPALIGEMA
ncbi:MAG: lipopolysaccharide biosynthesis protein [Acidimicrobiales bacterium]